ncbi:MAG: YkgJ family cysteine cluster protein [Desulfuromonadaceae bacterium]|nr:YkgJ family cysteine cluster protein [Desulfuromonadaceae bacterium]MDD2856459.1 YkgJ family cysteine cluster protein [Desulfuromonadaceae bacterium]
MTDCSTEGSGWEGRCKQCGSCCFEKIEDERGNIFYMQSACRFLDLDTRRCKIYGRRFKINPSCVKLTPELVQSLRWLPKNCGYHINNETEPPPARRGKRK